jgi:cell division septation protein DedD
MNKNEIAQVVEMFPLSSDVAKSLTNRLESALGKDGTPSARLRMASSSLLALSDKTQDEQDASMLLALGSFLVIASEIAKDNTPAPSTTTPKAPKKTREKWFDADSAEAQAITTPKPRTKKTNAPSADGISPLVVMLEEFLKTARG